MTWRHCSSCRTDIGFGETYWECSVSTCTRKRTGLFFCSVGCWEVHLPSMRHREAWAVEKTAPSQQAWEAELAAEREADEQVGQVTAGRDEPDRPLRRTVSPAKSEAGDDLPRDVLVVVTKLKKYVKARSGMNTSDSVMMVLSDELRRICDRAIRIAGENGRKTLLDRDIRDATK